MLTRRQEREAKARKAQGHDSGGDEAEKATAAPPSAPDVEPEPPGDLDAAGPQVVQPEKLISTRNKAAYLAYQREYQKKRRAQDKANREKLARMKERE